MRRVNAANPPMILALLVEERVRSAMGAHYAGSGSDFQSQPEAIAPRRSCYFFPEKTACEARELHRYGALPMLKITSFAILCGCFCAVSLHAAQPTFAPVSNKPFVIQDASGKAVSVPLVNASAQRKLTMPIAKVDPKLSVSLIRAASIAQDRAYAHSKSRCWRYVKEALLAAGAVNSYPKTANAKEAAGELVQNYGFKKLPVNDPYAAPLGSVLVYGGKGAGHVEIRNKNGFVSDFRAVTPSKRKLIGVYAKA